jgi:hypothetical protein
VTVEHVGGRPAKGQEIEMATKKRVIVDLKLRGISWAKIAEVVELHPKRAAAIYYAERGTASFEVTLDWHKADILGELEHMRDELAPHFYSDGSQPPPTSDKPPDKNVTDELLKILDKRIKIVRAEAAR